MSIGENKKYESYETENERFYYPDHNVPPILVGNCSSVIDWKQVIKNLEGQEGKVHPQWASGEKNYAKMVSMYANSDYCKFSVEWINFYPNINYDPELDYRFGNFIGKPNYARAWISEVRPGHTVFWHYDLDDQESEFLAKGKLIRYVVKMTNDLGHVAVLGNHATHGGEIGEIYQWPDHRIWHGSVNCSFTNKYQYNYLAYA